MATDQRSTQVSVSDLAELCMISFQDYLQRSATVHPRELSLSEDQLARFSLWANNIGVFTPGGGSMDHRLREAPEIIEIVIGLLDDLNDSIKNCSAALSACKSHKEYLDRDESTSSPTVDRSRQAIAKDISLLYRLTNTIRRASKESQNQKAAESFQIKDDEGNDVEACLRLIFTNYVFGRFPSIQDIILQRLAATMVLRRKRILYRRSRYGANPIKIRRSALQPVVTLPAVDQQSNSPEVSLAVHDQSRTSKRDQNTVESKAVSATTLAADAFKKVSAPSVISVTKTVALGNHEELVFPPAPTGRLRQKYNKLKRQRLEDHKTCQTCQASQFIPCRYVKEDELKELIGRLFGFGDHIPQPQLRPGMWSLFLPRHLTREELGSIGVDEGSTNDKEISVTRAGTQNDIQRITHQRATSNPDRYPSLINHIEEMEHKLKLNLEKDWIYCCQLIDEITCPFCFHALPSLDVADDNKWRAHVKNDLDAYVCLFEQCDQPDSLYNNREGWLQHMREHALRWRCTSKSHGVLIFDIKDTYLEHMRNSHGSYTEAQIRAIADRNAQIIGPLFESCPLCSTMEVPGSMEDHVISHLRSLALKSLPPYDDEGSDGSASGRDSLATSQPQSRSTIKVDPDGHVRPSFVDIGDNPKYLDKMNPFPSQSLDVIYGGRPSTTYPDIISIPDDPAKKNEIEYWSSDDHSSLFIDPVLLNSTPKVNRRSWEWGAITESYVTATTSDKDPIMQSIQRQKMLAHKSVNPEEASQSAHKPLKTASLASEDSSDPGHGRSRGSPVSSLSGATAESAVPKYRWEEGEVAGIPNRNEPNSEAQTFKHSSKPDPKSLAEGPESNTGGTYCPASSEVHDNELLRLNRKVAQKWMLS
ncbi:hypothetical protein ONS95_008226 [Cadophora gregata]|uniref:uncharacterized protein n=1 Tax=Cadophora gregata TaxID=51156 RepID=UPI0026DC0862|nr:uncharacterized protein ONS95_008226 [Cadophora gregata]KAK0126642.1 hypothetical protein ONS95_008226 [Cadophora gregata]